MSFKKNNLSLQEIREFDLVTYLGLLGHQPETIKKNGTDHWYLSPLRTEGDPSFKVNRRINRWYDFGLGRGGNLIDFGILYFGCSLPEFIQKFAEGTLLRQMPAASFNEAALTGGNEAKIIITGERSLYSYPLLHYLHERDIPKPVAERFCCEVTYEINGHSYYGIGFKNNSGGYEIRNAFFKCSSSPKDFTTIGQGAGELHVFEGFFDFLSFKTLYGQDAAGQHDCLILNGAAMFERARGMMSNYATKRLWLDLDTTGRRYTEYALSLNEGFKDQSDLYKEHKDLNEWLRNKSSTKKLSRKLRPK